MNFIEIVVKNLEERLEMPGIKNKKTVQDKFARYGRTFLNIGERLIPFFKIGRINYEKAELDAMDPEVFIQVVGGNFDEAVVVNSNNKFYGLKLDNEILPHIHFENGDAVNIRMNKYLGKIYRSNNH